MASFTAIEAEYDLFTEVPGVKVREIAEKIAAGFKNEPHLLDAPAESLAKSLEEGLAVVVMHGEEPVGYARLLPLIDDWYELGATWVHPAHRRHHHAQHMYERILDRHGSKNILLTTTNGNLLKLCYRLKFVLVPRKLLPEAVWKASCTCSPIKIGVKDSSFCQLALGEPQLCKDPCAFMVAPQTSERHGIRSLQLR